jgi:hypothetical protein
VVGQLVEQAAQIARLGGGGRPDQADHDLPDRPEVLRLHVPGRATPGRAEALPGQGLGHPAVLGAMGQRRRALQQSAEPVEQGGPGSASRLPAASISANASRG